MKMRLAGPERQRPLPTCRGRNLQPNAQMRSCSTDIIPSVGLTEVDEGVVHSFGVGDRFLVPAGMLHFEDHGPLRLVVGRRNLEEGSA